MDQPRYDPQRPNTGGGRIAVRPDPAADLTALIGEHLKFALAADPSPHHLQTKLSVSGREQVGPAARARGLT